ncbi:molybdenum cofactor biosynthesis protein MoaE [Fretibacter rubidus]|uniref:molybdenum cofactor biosynthesis protein MoaE n=1 Tax=Fretibacter rubidus TaxID=570162 RepID=UPI00352A7086
MSVSAQLTLEEIHTVDVETTFSQHAKGAGAVVTFRGIMRPQSKQGEPLDALILEWHPRMTQQSLEDIANDGLSQFNLSHVHIIHRGGVIKPHDVIVCVMVASDHRREAFSGADYIMDRLKTDAVFWKKEQGAFGTRWIDPTDRDHKDRQRWSEK